MHADKVELKSAPEIQKLTKNEADNTVKLKVSSEKTDPDYVFVNLNTYIYH